MPRRFILAKGFAPGRASCNGDHGASGLGVVAHDATGGGWSARRLVDRARGGGGAARPAPACLSGRWPARARPSAQALGCQARRRRGRERGSARARSAGRSAAAGCLGRRRRARAASGRRGRQARARELRGRRRVPGAAGEKSHRPSSAWPAASAALLRDEAPAVARIGASRPGAGGTRRRGLRQGGGARPASAASGGAGASSAASGAPASGRGGLAPRGAPASGGMAGPGRGRATAATSAAGPRPCRADRRPRSRRRRRAGARRASRRPRAVARPLAAAARRDAAVRIHRPLLVVGLDRGVVHRLQVGVSARPKTAARPRSTRPAAQASGDDDARRGRRASRPCSAAGRVHGRRHEHAAGVVAVADLELLLIRPLAKATAHGLVADARSSAGAPRDVQRAAARPARRGATGAGPVAACCLGCPPGSRARAGGRAGGRRRPPWPFGAVRLWCLFVNPRQTNCGAV